MSIWTLPKSKNKADPPRRNEGRKETAMIIWKRNEKTGLECGINDDGDLFLGDSRSGYTAPNTPENRRMILEAFDFYNDDGRCDENFS